MPPLDYKKEEKHLYLPSGAPALVDVPEMNFFMVDGQGDPNDPEGEYQHAIELLYALSYAVRMGGKKGSISIPGYQEYVVPPLEGLWRSAGNAVPLHQHKKDLRWTAMIRQPGFIPREAFQAAVEQLRKKKPHLNTALARMASFTEGLCVQCLHTGSYDEEPATIMRMQAFMEETGCSPDMDSARAHHEVYLSDPRKTPAERLKTVLRLPVTRHAQQ